MPAASTERLIRLLFAVQTFVLNYPEAAGIDEDGGSKTAKYMLPSYILL
jgi:hypothetical protein